MLQDSAHKYKWTKQKDKWNVHSGFCGKFWFIKSCRSYYVKIFYIDNNKLFDINIIFSRIYYV